MAPAPTITPSSIRGEAHCPHCEAFTVQVRGGSGITGAEPTACLQCIADGGTCCSLAPLNRCA